MFPASALRSSLSAIARRRGRIARHRRAAPIAPVGPSSQNTPPRLGSTEVPTPERTAAMANDSSFDVVSRLDRQEVDNAVNQCAKEIAQRYDFRGVDASVSLSGDTITLEANTAERVLAILDVLESKLFRRGVSLKALDLGDKEPRPSGKIYRLACPLREGLTQEVAKRITKAIRDEGPKSVKATIQGDEVRVTSKSRDDLQSVIALLKNLDVDAALQFVNYR